MIGCEQHLFASYFQKATSVDQHFKMLYNPQREVPTCHDHAYHHHTGLINLDDGPTAVN
jgi:hypothetical protein